MEIRELQHTCWTIAEEHGWHGDDDTVPVKLLLIHSEISEAVEEYRSHKQDYYVVDGKPEGFGIELADIIIRVLDLAGQLGIDMETMLNHKLAYNENRTYRHGGKRI